MIPVGPGIIIQEHEVELTAIRAQGAGGQNVNKVSSAIHLRFDIRASSLPEHYKERLLALKDQRLTNNGEIVIKGQRFRTQEKNRQDVLDRLAELVTAANRTHAKRVPTRPSRAAKAKRMDSKKRRGQIKSLRGRLDY